MGHKILMLTQVLPYPPDSGPKVKTLNVLKFLAQQHEVTLISFVRGDQSADVEHLRPFCRAIYTVPIRRSIPREAAAALVSLASGQPWMILRDDRVEMRQLVGRVANEVGFDSVHVDQLNMAQFVPQQSGIHKVLDAHNALWLLYRRLWETLPNSPKKLWLGRDWPLIKKYEGRVCNAFEAVLAVSQEDKLALEEAMGSSESEKITVIPIAVDTDEVKPVQRRPEADHILHIGTMFWPPNVDGVAWFAREIYPHISAQRPGAVFDVVGARPPQEIVTLGGNGNGINVTGYVADPTPYLESAGVMVVPLRSGGGMRVKILNALAQGLPIVTTSLGCEGIAVEHGRHLLVADTPADFAQATLRLLNNPAEASELGRQGRRLIQTTYDFRSACRPLETVYRS